MPGQSFVQNNNENNDYDLQNFYHEQANSLGPPMNSFPFPTATTATSDSEPQSMFSAPRKKGPRIKTKGPSSHYRKERERVLTNTPVETVIQKLIEKEVEAQETQKILGTVIARLDAASQRALKAEQERRDLETTQAMDSLKTSQRMLDIQQQAAIAQQDIAVYKLQLDQMKQDLRRAKEGLRNVEDERDDAERSASKARAQARKLNEERLVMIAREQGRKQGFEEGVLQGRLAIWTERREAKYITSQDTPLGSGTAFIEEPEDEESEEDGRPYNQSQPHYQHPQADIPRGMRSAHASHSGSHAGTRKTPRSRHPSLPEHARPHVSRSAPQVNTPRTQSSHVNGNGNGNAQTPHQIPRSVGTSSQESAVRQELEAVKEEAENLKREIEQREASTRFKVQQAEAAKKEAVALKKELEEKDAIREYERRQAEERVREAEKVKVRVREKEEELEKEKEAFRENQEALKEELRILTARDEMHEAEKELDLLKKEKMQKELWRQWEQEQEVRAKRQREQEVRERSDREREEREKAERERAEQERDKDKGRTPRLPYLPMPPPPLVVSPPKQGVVPPSPRLPSQRPPQQPENQAAAAPQPPFHSQPQQVQPDPRRHRRRTSSSSTTRSPSSTTSMSQLDLIAFPPNGGKVTRGVNGTASASGSGSGRGDETDRVRSHVLPDIPEVSEGRTSIATPSPPPPSWLRNPPVDHMKRVLKGQNSSDVEEWRKSTSDAMHTPLSAHTSSDLLSPGFRPRGQQVPNERPDLRRSPSSGSSFIDIHIEPPSRPPSPSHAGPPQGGDIEGYLSPKHGPAPLPMDSSQPVIPQHISEPPRGFVAFAPTSQGHGPPRGNGNGNAYPRSPRSIYAGMPASSSTSTSTSTWSPRAPVPATPRQLYTAPSPAPMPFNSLPAGMGAVIPPAPRGSGFYAATSPATMPFDLPATGSSGPGVGMGMGVPVIPSPPRASGTPHPRPFHFGGGGLTPASQPRELPSSSWAGGGMGNDSDSDSDGEDEMTKRNTATNAAAVALPIPPPSFQGRR